MQSVYVVSQTFDTSIAGTEVLGIAGTMDKAKELAEAREGTGRLIWLHFHFGAVAETPSKWGWRIEQFPVQ